MTKDRRSLQDRARAAQAAKVAKRDQERDKPVPDVACACGCGVWPEADMYYYVIDDVYVRYQSCANKVFQPKIKDEKNK